MTIANRTELARLFTGEGVELGVAAGAFSSTILQGPCARLWSVDRWGDHHNTAEYAKAARVLADAGKGRCIPLRMTFGEALPLFADGSLDFIYIDGYAHTGQEGGTTLREWWPKLKPGGIFAGHDYHTRWLPTMQAVDAFVASRQLPLRVTEEKAGYPSWWIRKPIDYVPAEMPVAIPYPRPSSCVLVGNGPSVLQCCGEEIDAFEEVVRFNRFQIRGFEANAGAKTTLWSTYGKANVGGAMTEYFPGDPDVRPDRILFRGDHGYPSYVPRELFRIPLKFHHELRAKLKARSAVEVPRRDGLIPSSGLLVAMWMLEVVGMDRIALAGFDHFQKDASKLHHYWIHKAYTQPREHDSATEAAMFAEVAAAGRVVYLPSPRS